MKTATSSPADEPSKPSGGAVCTYSGRALLDAIAVVKRERDAAAVAFADSCSIWWGEEPWVYLGYKSARSRLETLERRLKEEGR